MFNWLRGIFSKTQAEHAYRLMSFKTDDGLTLSARHYEAQENLNKHQKPVTSPLVCLAGLTRNSADFHTLAMALSRGPNARDVYALDSRGRGKSEYDSHWANYTIDREAIDALAFIRSISDKPIHTIGTSRGGLLMMNMAEAHGDVFKSVIFNDIGPVIEMAGLIRIAGYVGSTALPQDWDEATAYVKKLNSAQFTALSDEQWKQLTRALFIDKGGKPSLAYDLNLGKALAVPGPIPDLWAQFKSLSATAMMVIRGENSDLLSAQTVEAMQATRQSPLTRVTVKAQGHAPLLMDDETISQIEEFLAQHDR